MKKFYLLSGIIMAAAMIGSCTKAANVPTSVEEITTPTIDLSIIKIDSVKTDTTWKASPDAAMFAEECAPYFKAHIDVPDAEQAPLLANAVMEWMNEACFSGTCECPITGEKLCESYLNSTIFGKNEPDFCNSDCTTEIEIRKAYENAQIVTFVCTCQTYNLGAAHGGYSISGATFRKSDGKRFGWNMFNNVSNMNEVLKNGLKEYFEVQTDEELKDDLMIDEFASVDYLEHPNVEPWVTEKGIEFVYQQYEIACYAAGLPSFTLPLSKAQKMLTPTAKALMAK